MNQPIAHTALHKRSSQAAHRACRLGIYVVALRLTKRSTCSMHMRLHKEGSRSPPFRADGEKVNDMIQSLSIAWAPGSGTGQVPRRTSQTIQLRPIS